MIGITGLTALSGVIELSETAPILATMLGLAVGIDYALFILARHKQNLGDGMDVRESVAQADRHRRQRRRLRRHDRRDRARRPARHQHPVPVRDGPRRRRHRHDRRPDRDHAAARAARLLPASRLARANRLLGGAPQVASGTPVSARWVGFVTRRPVAVLLTGLALLTVVAIPATHMKLGLPDGSSEPTTSTERRSYDLLTEGFGPGFNGTLTVVVDAPVVARAEQEAVRQGGRRRPAGLPGRRRRLPRDAERGGRPLDRPGHARDRPGLG